MNTIERTTLQHDSAASGSSSTARRRVPHVVFPGPLLAAATVTVLLVPAVARGHAFPWRTFALIAVAVGVTALAAAVVTGPHPDTAPNRSERALRALATGPQVAVVLHGTAAALGQYDAGPSRIILTGIMVTVGLLLLARTSKATPRFAWPAPTEGLPLPLLCRLFKRTVDLSVGCLAVAATLPVIVASVIAVKGSSPGPWLFRQIRLGAGGRPFTVLKLRTMYVDNDASEHLAYVAALIKGEVAATGGVLKLTADRRVTSTGRWLRRLSLDELPQLFNVIGGSMSLVGPRPPTPDEAALYDDHARERLIAKPGITGLWQVSGRSRLTFAEMVDLDLRYLRDWTPLLEFQILARTPRVAFFARETA